MNDTDDVFEKYAGPVNRGNSKKEDALAQKIFAYYMDSAQHNVRKLLPYEKYEQLQRRIDSKKK